MVVDSGFCAQCCKMAGGPGGSYGFIDALELHLKASPNMDKLPVYRRITLLDSRAKLH